MFDRQGTLNDQITNPVQSRGRIEPRIADAARVGELSRESQVDAEVLLGNQIPETIALAGRARECGAFAACSFGAGFGGSVWALVERADAERFVRAWHPDAFIADPGPALIEL